MATIASLGPSRLYTTRDEARVHARCADEYALRYARDGEPLGAHLNAFMANVERTWTEHPRGSRLAPCPVCRVVTRGPVDRGIA